jgi:gamma-D-glutamyl-L-lysine dipeptidyl-peptidase
MDFFIKSSFMEFAVLIVPAAPVRRKPRHDAEMSSQLLFGEIVTVLKYKRDKWAKVRSLHDQYEGWISSFLLEPVSEREATALQASVVTDLLNTIHIGDKPMHIPAGANLPGFNGTTGQIGSLTYAYNGKWKDRFGEDYSGELLLSTALNWLNVPYMWGGRTPLGADCSGFVQVNAKLCGRDLPRDTWQQAQVGSTVKKLKDASPGDIVFFDDNDTIVHVGILVSPQEVLHEYGKVRIDPIDKKGIINADTGKRTHSLRLIRNAGQD